MNKSGKIRKSLIYYEKLTVDLLSENFNTDWKKNLLKTLCIKGMWKVSLAHKITWASSEWSDTFEATFL